MQNLSLERLNKRHPNITQRSEVIHYVLAALVAAVIKADGTVTSNETDAAVKIAEQLGMATSTKSEIDAYLKGTDDFRSKEVTINDLIELAQVLKSKDEKMNMLKVLIKISSADGILDKAEYLVISQVAQSFKMAIPEFESLAEKLNVETSNAARVVINSLTDRCACAGDLFDFSCGDHKEKLHKFDTYGAYTSNHFEVLQ